MKRATRDLRIVLIGDSGVGKTTLIQSLVQETFVPQVPHLVPELVVPPDVAGLSVDSSSQEDITSIIVDTSSREEDRLLLQESILSAHVLCLVYAVNQASTFQRLSSFWLPFVRQLQVQVPIILVGNKIDTRGDHVENEMLEMQVQPLMNEYREIETCIECSNLLALNISEVFYYAQMAVLHPTSPLYDVRDHSLKPACATALRRIFTLCDQDQDGVLNDQELNDFQLKCFGLPLQQQELEGVREAVREALDDGQGLRDNKLTVDGFLYLHIVFIQNARLETTWNVLRAFGYGDDLQLREGFLYPAVKEAGPDTRVELSSRGYQFFTELFSRHDKDKDGALNEEEYRDLFKTAPEMLSQLNEAITNEQGYLTLQGFLAQWSMQTLLDYRITLAYLAYLGYGGIITTSPGHLTTGMDGCTLTALKVLPLSLSPSRRQVYLTWILGATGSGKTAVLRRFLNKPFTDEYTPTLHSPLSVVNSVDVRGVEKYLILQEWSQNDIRKVLDSKVTPLPDVICLVYDGGDVNSFAFLAQLRAQYSSILDKVPLVFVSLKGDLETVQQRFALPPSMYCQQLGLAAPMHVSIKGDVLNDLYHVLVGVAMDPEVARVNKKKVKFNKANWTATLLGLATLGLGVMVAYRVWRGMVTTGSGSSVSSVVKR